MSKSGFSKIIVAVDGSEVSLRAADHAARIAKQDGAGLIALHVVPVPPFAHCEPLGLVPALVQFVYPHVEFLSPESIFWSSLEFHRQPTLGSEKKGKGISLVLCWATSLRGIVRH